MNTGGKALSQYDNEMYHLNYYNKVQDILPISVTPHQSTGYSNKRRHNEVTETKMLSCIFTPQSLLSKEKSYQLLDVQMELNQTLELGHIDSNFIIPWKKSYDSKKITLVESWEFSCTRVLSDPKMMLLSRHLFHYSPLFPSPKPIPNVPIACTPRLPGRCHLFPLAREIHAFPA